MKFAPVFVTSIMALQSYAYVIERNIGEPTEETLGVHRDIDESAKRQYVDDDDYQKRAYTNAEYMDDDDFLKRDTVMVLSPENTYQDDLDF